MGNRENSNPEIVECIFIGNAASGNTIFHGGGGIRNLSSDPTVTNCSFIGNTGFAGGGMSNGSGIGFSSSPTVTNCIFAGNGVIVAGGGMYNHMDSNPTVTNCTFSGNSTVFGGGGGMNNLSSNPTVTNCTFYANLADGVVGGGGISNSSGSNPTVSNCIVWGNIAPYDPQISGLAIVTYTNVEGGFSGTGNIDLAPLFVDADGLDDIPGTPDDNLRLSSGSPAIDAADNSAAPTDSADLDDDGDTDEPIPVDLDGNPRFVDDPDTPDTGNPDGLNPIVDMGAYEFQGPLLANLDIKPGSCPNPLNRHGNGVLPVALVGTGEFDPAEVDLSTLQLSRADGIGGSVGPNEGPPGPHSMIRDAARPFDGEPCDCQHHGPDSIDDLSMKFRTDDMVEALELNALPGGAVVELMLSGSLLDGTPFAANDCILILPPGDMSPTNAHVESNVVDTFVEVVPLDLNFDDDGFADFSRSYYGGTAMTLTAPPQSAGRRFVRWLIDGAPQPIGMRTIEVIVSEDTTLKAAYARPTRATPEHPTESDGPLE